MIFSALMLMVQAGVPTPVPVPVAPPPIAVIPPPVMTIPAPPNLRSMGIATPVSVRVSAGGQTLFDDTLRVDSFSGAYVNMSRSEAGPDNCPTEFRTYGGNQTGLNFRLSRRNGNEANYFSLTLSWTRLTEGQSCQSGGTRTATLNQNVELKPGQSVRLTGDGGVVVELRRR